jgi:hypothetical protein
MLEYFVLAISNQYLCAFFSRGTEEDGRNDFFNPEPKYLHVKSSFFSVEPFFAEYTV